jgi:hypothetical protein
MGKLGLTRLTTARTWGKSPPSPLWYTLCLSTRPTSKWHFVPGLPSGSLEIPIIRTPTTLGPITLRANLRLGWGLKKNCSPYWKIFNGMSHTTFTGGNRGNFQLLVVGSQIVNLTPGPSFGHNLCFRCSNGSCKLNLDIYVPRIFQWYKKCLNPLSFDPYTRFLKIRESIWDSNSQDESSLGSVRVHSLTLFCIPGSMRCDSWASLLAYTFASPCFGREPKVRVATHNVGG